MTVLLEPVPANEIFESGTNTLLEETAVTTRLETGVSESPIVNEIGPTGESSFTVTGFKDEIVGKLFSMSTIVNTADAPEGIKCLEALSLDNK